MNIKSERKDKRGTKYYWERYCKIKLSNPELNNVVIAERLGIKVTYLRRVLKVMRGKSNG